MDTPKDLLKELKKETGKPLKELVAERPNNDPYNVGTEGEIKKAKWFKQVWEDFGGEGKHLRRIHYAMQSHDDYEMYDGKIYENTAKCWRKLSKASKKARRLQLVDPTFFIDQRNPDVYSYNNFYNFGDPYWEVASEHPDFSFPEISAEVLWDNKATNLLPSISVKLWNSYSETGERTQTKEKVAEDLQPELQEVWIEKSTMDDVLKPVCDRLNANLKTFVGHASITAALNFITRVKKANRPGRILYISDHDTHGNSMPLGVARKLEFWTDRIDNVPEIRLQRIALTWEQVKEYDLPHAPDEEAVELDALQELHPGALPEIVENCISRNRDQDIKEKLKDQQKNINEGINELQTKLENRFGEEASEIKKGVEEKVDKYQEKIEEMIGDLEEDFQEELEPYKERFEKLNSNIDDFLEENEIDTPDVPEGEEPTENDHILFYSERDYLEQLEKYDVYKES